MRRHDYDTDYNKNTGGTEKHVAVDTKMKNVIKKGSSAGDENAYEEGFASAHGVRPDTAASGGRIKHPEMQDDTRPDPSTLLRSYDETSRTPDSIEKENPGLADN